YVVELDWYPDAPGEIVVLTCNTPEEDGITWTSDQSNEVLGSGKTLTIQVKEFGDAGQYTCHKGGEVLSHSLLLLHKKEDGIWSTDILKDQKGVTCGAATLSAERVRVDHREYKKYTVECQEGSACPAAEESLPIEVVVEAVHKLKYENYTSSFFIRDIIKPDPPKNLQLKPLKNSRHVEVSWEYPDTWSTPHSYFSLTFCVQVQGKNKRERESQCLAKLRKCPCDLTTEDSARALNCIMPLQGLDTLASVTF
ncbi:Interleukin-12 subunit beta, partial [Eschrichtius robustus]|nr:Interleukin-12 subunit beta [Eschrichtius robustus]